MNKILYEDKSEFCETKSEYVNIHKSFWYAGGVKEARWFKKWQTAK